MSPVVTPAVLRGGISVGVSTGGGYAQSSGYYTTQYQWVPTTALSGYDAYSRPISSTRYVQQAFQVWVPTSTYVAPSYGHGYSRPGISIGFGFGSGHRSGHWGGHRGGGGHRGHRR